MPLYMDLHDIPGASEEPVEVNQDPFGSTLGLAARICNHAEAEQILMAFTVQELCAGKGFTFAEPAEAMFKGFDTPTKICSVIWQS